MKRFYAIFAAMLISICSFASRDVIPDNALLADYYDQGNVCMCFFVPADMACNDMVITGSFNGWSSTVSECAAVEPVEGYDGWYVASFTPEAEPDVVKGIEAKPIMLDVDGNWNWEYQVGAATVIRGGVQVVQGVYAGEIDLINLGTDAPNVFTVDAWKQNPCTAIYHNYNVTVVSNGCGGYIVPFIVGGMNGWSFQQMQYSPAKTAEYGGVPTYEISFKAPEGTPYQIVSGKLNDTGEMEVEPGWYDDAYMQMLVDGAWVRIPGEDGDNFLTHENPNIVWDLRVDTLQWARCDETPAEYVIVALNLPTGCRPEAIEIIGDFDGWEGTAMELLNTGWHFVALEAKANQSFKIRSAGSWDVQLEFYNAENNEWYPTQDNQFVFGELWSDDTYKGTPCKWIELDFSDPSYFRWSDCPGYHVNLTGITGGYINNYGSIRGDWSGYLPYDTYIQLECYPENYYPYCGTFEGWSDGVTNKYRSFYLTQDTTIAAIVSGREIYQVSITAGAHGHVSNSYVGTRYACQGDMFVEAQPDHGYCFAQWSDGVTDNPRYIEFSQDTTITAEFVQCLYTNVKIGDLYYDLNFIDNTATVLGSSSGATAVSVTDNSIAEWNALPQEYVFEANCPADAALVGLKSVKVFADQDYINILVEPDMNELPDREAIPFHVLINTDNSDATGGAGDWFTDANTDILMEGFLYMDYAPCSYQPEVFAWIGEVGGSGWSWDWLNQSAPVYATQHVNGYIEIQMLRANIPTNAGWNSQEFGIGFDVQQSWEPVGILPCASPTDANPAGRAAKMQVRIYTNEIPSETGNPNLVIPSSVTYNDENYTVTTITREAFKNHTEITSVEIPTSMTYIYYNAFQGCDSITSVVWKAINCNTYRFGSQVESFVFGNEVEVIPYDLCSGMNLLTSITIPDGVRRIDSYAFAYCQGLSSLTIPNSVDTLGYHAIYNCRSLTHLRIPASTIFEGQFELIGCTSLTYLEAPASIFSFDASTSEYDIEEYIYEYGDDMQYFPHNIDTLILNSGTMNVLDLMCIALCNKTMRHMDLGATENIELQDEAFAHFYNLRSLVLPQGLEKINYMAIANCKSLESITIPASVTEIGMSAFENCYLLESVNFAQGSMLNTIGVAAFYNCHELQSINIPEGVTEIGKLAFYDCTYLNDVVVPSSVQAIGDNAFALCARMQQMRVKAAVPPSIASKTFEQVSREMPVYVPMNSVNAYKADPLWGEMNIIGVDEQFDAVDNVTTSTAPTKQLINGQLYILRGDKTYTAQGQEVK